MGSGISPFFIAGVVAALLVIVGVLELEPHARAGRARRAAPY
jgi:hypothetical protein